jgi:hypothetical protein
VETVFVTAGIVFMAGALNGGGLSAFGVTLPALASVKRQILLFLLGAVLLFLGIYPSQIKRGPQNVTENNQNVPQTNTEQPTQNNSQEVAQNSSQEVAQNNASATTPIATMGELERGVNRDAHDLDNKGRYAANEYDCSELCRANGDCVAMTYVISHHTCWLKGVVPPQTPNSDMVSAVKDKPK